MKKLQLLVGLLIFNSVYAFCEHECLLHTHENIRRLNLLILNNPKVKAAWYCQLNESKNLLKSKNLSAKDCPVLALTYRMTGNERYAESIKNILLDYTARDTWEGQELLNRKPPWKGGLSTSHTSFYIAIGYDCIYDYLSEEERLKIANGIYKNGVSPLINDWLDVSLNIHTLDAMGHNWWSACVYMAGFASLAVRNEIPEALHQAIEIEETAQEWFNYSGSILQNKPPSFDKDGGFYESINYASYGISQYLLFRYAFQNVLPQFKQTELPILEKIPDFFIYTTYYPGKGEPLSVNFGDSHYDRNGNSCMVLLWNLGYQKERYAWYLKKVNDGNHKEGFELNTPIGLILYPELPKLKDTYIPDLPLSHLYSNIGWATLRNKWEDNATMLAVKSGFTWNHAHADAGSYILFHNDKNLIIDAGTSSYSNPLYTEYYCQSKAHNVILFDSQGQNRDDPYFGVVNHGSLHNLIDGDGFKYVLANVTGPYSHILKRNYRSFLWIGDVILVIDDLLAYNPGQFEWLLHYNGESKRDGLDLSIKQENAEILVRPLYPETFPNGGLPHDFPEQMRLEERLGYKDHQPELTKAYWSVSHFKKTDRTKFITAIILKTNENKNSLPVIERFEGINYLGVRIFQNGKISKIYLNLLADGRLKHRNSIIDLNGWQTDAYILALTYKQGPDKSSAGEINQLFVSHGSYVRREKKVFIHALSKYTALVDNFSGTSELLFKGQPFTTLNIRQVNKNESVKINGKQVFGIYDPLNQLLKLKINQ